MMWERVKEEVGLSISEQLFPSMMNPQKASLDLQAEAFLMNVLSAPTTMIPKRNVAFLPNGDILRASTRKIACIITGMRRTIF